MVPYKFKHLGGPSARRTTAELNREGKRLSSQFIWGGLADFPVPEASALGRMLIGVHLQDSTRGCNQGDPFLPPRHYISAPEGSLSLQLLPASNSHCSGDLGLQASIQACSLRDLQQDQTLGLATPTGLQTCIARDCSRLAPQSLSKVASPATSFYWHPTEGLTTLTFPLSCCFKKEVKASWFSLCFLTTPFLVGGREEN